MGVATVGSRINGLCDAIVDGETGVLVPPRNAGALYEALASLLDAPERIARLGAVARDRARRLFDAKQVNRLVAEEYLRLLQKAGRFGPDKGASCPAGDSQLSRIRAGE
jgi:glycosyltransferase involved in cell wall biosynthesis